MRIIRKRIYLYSTAKKLHISVSAQFRPELSMGQLDREEDYKKNKL